MKIFLKLKVILILGITVATSCKKESEKDVQNTDDCLLTSISDEGGTSNTTFEYDSDKRVTSINYIDASKNESGKDVITYNDRVKEIIVESYSEGVKGRTTYYTIGSKGNLERSQYNYSYINGGYNFTEINVTTYSQNSEGYISNITSGTDYISDDPNNPRYNNTSSTTYNYQNGNLTSETHVFNGEPSSSTTFEYYTDKENTLPQVVELFSDGLYSLISKPNKNLLKKLINQSHIIEFSYTFNSIGQITKRKAFDYNPETGPSTGITTTQLIGYNCK